MSEVFMKKNSKKQIEEFEKKDLGEDIKKSGVKTHKVKPRQKSTSILLPERLIKSLKEKAEKRGLPYQTFLKMILMENINKY